MTDSSKQSAPLLISPVTLLEGVGQRRVAHADVDAHAQRGRDSVHGVQIRPRHLLQQPRLDESLDGIRPVIHTLAHIMTDVQ